MLRESINADNDTDVEAVVARLRTKCTDAGISQIHTDLLLKETREVLSSMIAQGRRLSSVTGSQMKVSRDITGDDYAININFGAGLQRESIWQRLFGAFRRN